MNKERRKIINTQWHAMEELKAMHAAVVAKAEEIKAELENVRDEEQESFDNMPEGLQQSDRGQTSEQAIANLDTAINALDEIAADIDLDEAMEALDNAEHG
ncbi:uncharacterized Zn finger protein (UPF0148 family) [Massilia sp. MP_M2]|uniref:hypothetical protein n=1 Tax=Massilia sp. MP_M2 TaxID=3071713 RepID=UPI00319D92E1